MIACMRLCIGWSRECFRFTPFTGREESMYVPAKARDLYLSSRALLNTVRRFDESSSSSPKTDT